MSLQSYGEKKQYDRQVILNLGSGRTCRGLMLKAKTKNLPSKDIHLSQSFNCNLKDLNSLTLQSRLYLIGHCSAGCNYINSDSLLRYDVSDYVSLLNQYAPHLKEKNAENRIKISIVACEAALDKEGNKSFAYLLSQALDKEGIPAEVIAREKNVNRVIGNSRNYKKLVEGEHHKNGSKIVFITNGGKTTSTSFIYR